MSKKDNPINEWLSNNLLTIIQLIWPLLAMFGIFIYGKIIKEEIDILSIILIILLLGESTIFVIKALWMRYSYKAYQYPHSKIKTDYIVLERIINYCVENGVFKYSRKYKIKALKHGIRGIIDKFLWTGNAPIGLLIPGSEVKSIKLLDSIGVWKYFEVEFDRELNIGEEREFEYKWPDINDYKLSSSFTSTSTEEPTKKVVITVQLGTEYANEDLVLEEFRSIEGMIPINVQKAKLNANGHYEWIPHRCKRFRCYRVRWVWSKSDSIPQVQTMPQKEEKN